MSPIAKALSGLQRLLNALLPFTIPGTPLIQDIVHTLALCTLLYFGPQISDHIRTRRSPSTTSRAVPSFQDVPETERLVEQGHDVIDDDPTAQIVGNEPVPNTDLPVADRQDRDLQPTVEDADDIAGPAPPAQLPLANTPPNLPAGDQQIPVNAAAAALQARQQAERPASSAANRPVGTKKAKSLARKDQWRAYNEFQREQGELQRAKDREGAEEREAALEKERMRRADAEQEIYDKSKREREEKRAREERARALEMERRERAVTMVRSALDQAQGQGQGFVWLEEVAKATELEKGTIVDVLDAAGVLGERDGVRTMLTGTGCIVRVYQELMEAAYEQILRGSASRVGMGDVGHMLEREIKARAST